MKGHSNLFARFQRQVIKTAKQNGIADFSAMPLRQQVNEGSIDPDSYKTQFSRPGSQHQKSILAPFATQRIDALFHIVR